LSLAGKAERSTCQVTRAYGLLNNYAAFAREQ